MYAETPKQFNETYRICIAPTEQEVDTIIRMGVFSGNKTGFVRPGHKLYVCDCILKVISSHTFWIL